MKKKHNNNNKNNNNSLSLSLSVYLSIYLSIHLSLSLSLYMYIYIYIHMYTCIYTNNNNAMGPLVAQETSARLAASSVCRLSGVHKEECTSTYNLVFHELICYLHVTFLIYHIIV